MVKQNSKAKAKPQEKTQKRNYYHLLYFLPVVILVTVLVMIFLPEKSKKNSDTTTTPDVPEAPIIDEPTGNFQATKPAFIDLQDVVNNWRKDVRSGSTSVYIYDLDNEKVAAEVNAEKDYNIASLYKLFVVYEGYRRVNRGDWNPDEKVFSSYSINDCLDLSIRESYSPCAERLWNKIGRSELNYIVNNDFGIIPKISSMSANAKDIAEMLKIYYKHEGISNEQLEKIKDSMLNQPPTNKEGNCAKLCDWRQGLPSGFSPATKVYNKVGWAHSGSGKLWNFYHDAAILVMLDPDTLRERHYIAVVMTSQSYIADIQELGKRIENNLIADQ